ncbi:MAG: OmpA family protein [Spirochaetales bacterium]|nr:OmpA family protein [Spirochaetales bacterium]
MNRRAVFFLFLLIFSSGVLFAEVFRFKYQKDEKYRIVTTVNEEVYINEQFNNKADFLNKISVSVLDTKNGAGNIAAHYQVSSRTYGLNIDSYTMEEEADSVFWQNSLGYHTVDKKYLYPLMRNLPVFPEKDIKPAESWTATGNEVHDLMQHYGIPEPYIIPVTAEYTYLGNTDKNGKKIAQFKIQYSFFSKVNVKIPKGVEFYPVQIAGKVVMIYNWDIQNGKPDSYNDEFHILYLLSTGDTVEFVGKSQGNVFLSQTLDREKTKQDIVKELEKEKVEDVKVEQVEEGVKLTLDNIQFEPDSDNLLQSEMQKLNKISEILKKYPDRDIKIVGHAAKRGTEAGQLALSLSRAKAVANYLLKIGARTPDKMTTVGKGATEPVADNNTEEGRIKNRRVEIILLEN